MQQFSTLFKTLEQSNSRSDKILVLADYFQKSEEKDRLWAVALLSGRLPKRLCTSKDLLAWGMEASSIPEWLFDASGKIIDDVAETVALLLPQPDEPDEQPLFSWMETVRMLQLRKAIDKKTAIQKAWMILNPDERILLNKIITGAFSLYLPEEMLVKGIALATGINEHIIAHRLSGKWSPEINDYHELFVREHVRDYISKPYPWCAERTVDDVTLFKKNPAAWSACYQWDGISVQLILRKGELFLWSEDGRFLNNNFPEIDILKHFLPDGLVFSGQIVAYSERPRPINELQTRLRGKKPGQKKMMATPVVMFVTDLLEFKGADIRREPFRKRRGHLEALLKNYKSNGVLKLDWKLGFDTEEALEELRQSLRQAGAVGLLLRKQENSYLDGSFLLKSDPLCITGILVYVEINNRSGRVRTLSLAVHDGMTLQQFTKVLATLSDEDHAELSEFVKGNTTGRYGSSRSIIPELIFEIAFDNVFSSTRHKSGLVLRNPQLKFWRKDLNPDDAGTLRDLQNFI